MEITPFTVAVPDAEVRDLVARLTNTRWPSDVVTDWSRGVPTTYARKLVDRWANDFDWAAKEAGLNAFPQFIATRRWPADPLRACPVSRRRRDAVAAGPRLPELLRRVHPDDRPARRPGGPRRRPEDAFHVVIPSLPGFGFSTPVLAEGWGIQKTAEAFDAIMQALGYERYGVHGGDIGAGIAEALCIRGGDRIIGSLVVTDPGAIATEFTPPTDHLTDEEKERLEGLKAARAEDFGYLQVQTTRPQSIAYGLTDSPVAQLTWIVEKIREWTDPAKALPEDAVDIDHLLTLVSVYWFGKGGAGAANFLYEAMHAPAAWGQTHDRPQGFVAFGDEPLIRKILDPRHELAYWNQYAEGGHFPAMEVPDLVVRELRTFFAGLR